MLLVGVISSFLGALIMWQFSVLLGVMLLIFGLFLIGREYITPQEEPRSFRRDYGGEAPSYDISSKPRR